VQALFVGDGREPAAVEVALDAAGADGRAVAHVVVRDDEIALLRQKAGEAVVARDVLGDAVDQLDDRLRLLRPVSTCRSAGCLFRWREYRILPWLFSFCPVYGDSFSCRILSNRRDAL
jgi:hypothetical protein